MTTDAATAPTAAQDEYDPDVFFEIIELPPREEPRPLFVDLGPYLDGTAKQEIPTVAEAWPGRCLFYAGRLNEVHAEPGTGKTNVLMVSCVAVLESGGNIIFIDPEDTPKGFATRLLMLGADAEAVRERVHYLHNPTPEEITLAQEWAKEHSPTLVILDGLAESMAAVGASEDKAQEVLSFFRETLRPFTESGAAVVIADHVTKSTEGRGQFARGSGAKAGRYDGVSYEIVTGTQYTPTQEGFVKLRIAKDRNGGAGPRGKIVAELHFSPGHEGHTITHFREPKQLAEGEKFRPTAIMEKIEKHLALYGTATKRELRALGKSQYVDSAIEIMSEEGALHIEHKGQKLTFSLVKKEAGND